METHHIVKENTVYLIMKYMFISYLEVNVSGCGMGGKVISFSSQHQNNPIYYYILDHKLKLNTRTLKGV